jgi:hypothetical protein
MVWVVGVACIAGLTFGLLGRDGFGSNLPAEAVGIRPGLPAALAFLDRVDEA